MRDDPGLIGYALRRILQAVPLLLAAASVIFLLLHLAPGDPAAAYLHPDIPAEVAEQVRRDLGLGRPLHEQFVSWLGALLTGDLGYSISQSQPVARAIGSALPDTLLLGGTALLISFGLGGALGVFQGARAGGRADRTLSAVTLAAYSLPAFWLAILLLLLFSTGPLRELLPLPLTGATSVDYGLLDFGARATDRIRHLVLPAAALSLAPAAAVARHMRSAVVEAGEADHVRAARARGLSSRAVTWRHVARNALLPLTSLFGLYVPRLMGGAVVLEVIFSWAGMGRLLYRGVLARDYPLVLAATLLFAALVVVGNLVADLLYAAVDPRVRYGDRSGRG